MLNGETYTEYSESERWPIQEGFIELPGSLRDDTNQLHLGAERTWKDSDRLKNPTAFHFNERRRREALAGKGA